MYCSFNYETIDYKNRIDTTECYLTNQFLFVTHKAELVTPFVKMEYRIIPRSSVRKS